MLKLRAWALKLHWSLEPFICATLASFFATPPHQPIALQVWSGPKVALGRLPAEVYSYSSSSVPYRTQDVCTPVVNIVMESLS